MTAEVEFDPRTGKLVVDEATLEVLVGHAAGVRPDRGSRALAALRAVDAVRAGGRVNAALDLPLETLRHPRSGTLSLSYAGRALHGWVSARTAALLLPADECGRRTLLRLHPSLLPEALGRAVDLSPRPHPAGPTSPDELVASATVTRWWRLAVGWTDDGGDQDGRMLEVVDTYGGLYTVEPSQAGQRVAQPITATAVWRLLVRLTARNRLDGLQPLPPDAELPRGYG